MPISRRNFIAATVIAATIPACTGSRTTDRPTSGLVDDLQDIERRFNGRLGAHIIDTENGANVGWRENERFAHASSFKMSLAAMLLARSERWEVDLEERLHWSEEDILFVSPVTKANTATGLTVRELAAATQITSDNTAANVLLKRFGGPSEVTRFWRSIGDDVSRLDRYEPELNDVPPGTSSDTTSPSAMARTVKRLIVGGALSPENRALLSRWMIATETGLERLRAGFPSDWIAGDKTGTAVGDQVHTYVDLAFGGPEGHAPLIVAAYFEPNEPQEPMDANALGALAAVGRIAASIVQ